MLVVGDAATLKVHVHTDEPERATALFDGAGEVSHLDVADMHAQVDERAERLAGDGRRRADAALCGALAVVLGRRACAALFEELGAHALDGGADAEPVDLRPARRHPRGRRPRRSSCCPTRPNVIMAAERAAELSDKQVRVVPTRSQQAGLAAAIALDPTRGAEDNAAAMERRARAACAPAASRPAARDDRQRPLRGRRRGRLRRRRARRLGRARSDAARRARAARRRRRAGDLHRGRRRAADARRGRRAGARRRRARALRRRPAAWWWLLVRRVAPDLTAALATIASVRRLRRRRRTLSPRRAASRPPVRWPRPARPAMAALRCRAPRRPRGGRASCSGSHTVGDAARAPAARPAEARTVAALAPGETASVVVEVRCDPLAPGAPARDAAARRGDGRRRHRADGGDVLQPAVARAKYRPGTRLLLTGKYAGPQPLPRAAARADERGRGRPPTTSRVYPATEGITSTQILTLVQRAPRRGVRHGRAAARPAAGGAAAARPRRPRCWPRTSASARAGAQRLAFEELLLDQIVQLRLRDETRQALAGHPARGRPTLSATWLASELPFTPTDDQRSARSTEVDADLARERPMQRLLMGEVGSGKTVVALHAMLRAVEHGAQAALMAPTETLAEQHFATLQALMPGGARPGGAADRLDDAPRGAATTLRRLATGELPLVVGTHALIEDTRRVPRPRGRRRRRAASLRRRPAPRARREGAGGPRAARAAHDRHADPAHAAPGELRRAGRDDAQAAAARAASRSRPTSPTASARARAPTNASARSCAPAARRSSSARWWRSPSCCRRARRPRSTSG